MQTHDAFAVHQHVAAQLSRIALRTTRATASGKQLHVRPASRRAIDMPQVSLLHPIGRVKASRFIDQQRPLQAEIAGVGLGVWLTLKRHDGHLHAETFKILIVLAQLRQMLATRQSGEMTMEHQQ